MRLFYKFLIACILCTPTFLAAQNLNSEKLARKLVIAMEKSPDDFHSVNIVLSDRGNLEALDEQLSAQRASLEQRSEAVITALKNKAQESQPAVLERIKNSPLTKPGTVASFWISNTIICEAKKSLIAELSNNPAVEWIGLNGKIELESFTACPAPPVSPNGHEKGLTVIGAPQMWAMGYTGYGRKALTNDTGVDPTRPALNTSYRGNTAPPEQSFFQMNGGSQIQDLDAFDCQYHGTHVTGTIVGLDRLKNDTIGVAFNGQWMGAASLNVCGGNTGDLLGAFQWSLDPDGNPATANDMPDVINNSWYDPSIDTIDCFSAYLPMVEAMEAAGIAVVFSAGNAGPNPSTITPPHNINVNLVNSFTVGALNGNASTLPIADFSSRGPSHCVATDSSLIIKPEVSAPGVDVRSCLPGDEYGLLSGTSMAAPHVSGAVMLLKEAFPYLTGKEIKLALYFTAIDLGTPGEDNVFGMGVINLPAAFNYLVAQGNVPVSPHVTNDVLIVNLDMPAVTCESEVSFIVLTVENGGSAPLTSFDVHYEAGGASNTVSWTGNLAQSQRAEVILPALPTLTGVHRMKATLLNPNGVPDERPLNNSIERKVEVLDRTRLVVNAEGTSTGCEGASVLLRAEHSGPGFASIKWYDEPIGGNVIGQGLVYATPPLTVADTVYAEATYIYPLGLQQKNGSASEVKDLEGAGLFFNAERSFKLKSVKVFAEEKGLRQFTLIDDFGTELQNSVINITQVGEFVVNLNWEIPPISGLQIVKKGGKGLYVNSSGVSYPMSQPGIATITGPKNAPAGSYYYFYDWKIEIPEVCERTQVIVPVNGAGSTPGASFTTSVDSVNLLNNQAVQFTNTSASNIVSFDWNFGDGTGSGSENPTHFYSAVGNYIVSLAVTSADGCTSFALDTIQVTNNELSSTTPAPTSDEVLVYPNPTSNSIFVHLEMSESKMVEMQLSDLTGKILLTKNMLASQKDQVQFDISEFSTGVYFLLIKMDGNNSVWKVVKL